MQRNYFGVLRFPFIVRFCPALQIHNFAGPEPPSFWPLSIVHPAAPIGAVPFILPATPASTGGVTIRPTIAAHRRSFWGETVEHSPAAEPQRPRLKETMAGGHEPV
jgi:hypothetical protein